eukprot:TRINITY_DN17570_c0_g4_i1.p1 TRINITY_DN17570_c0_g4~~TRINITY_DN17570_c0_g4_i1.p1  ORF type:complete len:410 (+),score=69.18 TRINITY_DN17570_c0_g4_i1:43-1230(+)
MLSKAFVLACTMGSALGCSYVGITAPNGEEVVGRTMEAGAGGTVDHMQWEVLKIPPRTMMPHNSAAAACYGTPFPDYEMLYGTVAIALPFGNGQYLFTDGMNDQGLTVGMHILREAKYEPIAPNMQNSLCYSDINGWLLGQFSSVSDMRERLPNTHIVYNPQVSTTRGMWTVTDAEGEHAVLEWTDGHLTIVNNTLKVLSNDPTYTWHVKNLENYMQVSPYWQDQSKISIMTDYGEVPVQKAHGVNLGGLPGDAMPASRFARLFYMKQISELVNPMKNINDAINLITAVLNSVFIPKGSVASKVDVPDFTGTYITPSMAKTGYRGFDYTEWSALKVTTTKQYMMKTYMDNQWKLIDLTKIHWGTRVTSTPLFDGQTGIKDITPTFKSVGTNGLKE